MPNKQDENSEESKEKKARGQQYRSQYPAYIHSFDTISGLIRDMLGVDLKYQMGDKKAFVPYTVLIRQLYLWLKPIVSPQNKVVLDKNLTICYRQLNMSVFKKSKDQPFFISQEAHIALLKCESIIMETFTRGNMAYGIEKQQAERDKWNSFKDY